MFDLEDRKYTKAEVAELLRKQKFQYEENLSEKKDRIFDLVEKSKALIAENNTLKRKDKLVGKAIVDAVEKAKEIEDTAKKKFENGINRLKFFEGKFVNYYKKIQKKYPIDEDIMKLEDFLLKMDEVLNLDNMSKNEVSTNMFETNDYISAKEKQPSMLIPNESGFDINEALNPSKDLEDICRELGLIQ